MRLNIGGGPVAIDGFVTVDRAVGSEAYPLAYPDGSVDEIYASHVLEHFSHDESEKAIADWVRALKPGGRIRISVPDWGALAKMYVDGKAANYSGYLMGRQTDSNDFHKSAYTFSGLRASMARAGLVGISEFAPEYDDCSRFPFSANAEAFKPSDAAIAASRSRTILAVMNLPRLGFSACWGSIHRVLTPRGINLVPGGGAFWEQSMQKLTLHALGQEPDWILAIDYDTVFNDAVFDRLCLLLEMHPHIDALAPLQSSRNKKSVLFWNSGKPFDARLPVVEVDSAHFGLTLIRTSALRKMPLPMFLNVPAPDGTWGPGHTDADIYFWQKWKEIGNTVAIAPSCPVGHLELMCLWPRADGTQMVSDVPESYWGECTIPDGVRKPCPS